VFTAVVFPVMPGKSAKRVFAQMSRPSTSSYADRL